MKNSTKILFYLLLLPTLALCVLILLRVFGKSSYYTDDITRTQNHLFEKAQVKIAIWSTNQYVSIDETNQLNTALRKVDIEHNSFKLNASQQDDLVNSILNFLVAFHAGNYLAYKEFRLPINWIIADAYYDKVIKYISQQTGQSTADLRLKSQDEISEMFVKLRSDGAFYKNFFTSVCPQEVKVEINKLNAPPADLAKEVEVENGTNSIGVASYDPIYSFDRSPDVILHEDGELIYAKVKLLIKTKEPDSKDMPCPVYLSLIWDRKTTKWLPWQLVSGNFWQNSKVILVF